MAGWAVLTCVFVQIGTTKGTGGDVLILEEAAYCDEGFFYETVAPILSIGSASLVAISTLTSEINFYTRLIKMIDPATNRPLFVCRSIELACEACKEDGRAHECVHLLHLVPRWQSEERHRKLKIMMQDRPDLIQSELAGLAFDSLQQVFRKPDIAKMFETPPLPLELHQPVWLVIDPAGGGPQSDYAIVSICRSRGCVTVSPPSLRDDVRLEALVDEGGRALRLVGVEGDDELGFEILEKTRELRHARAVHVEHALLERGVDVEEEEEEREGVGVRGDARALGDGRELQRGRAVVERGGDGARAVDDERAQQREVLLLVEVEQHVGEGGGHGRRGRVRRRVRGRL